MTGQSSEIRFGDLVEYDLRRSHGGDLETAYVVGAMKYSDDVVLLASETAIGMPIHHSHLRVISSGHETEAVNFRRRYMDRWPELVRPCVGDVPPVEA